MEDECTEFSEVEDKAVRLSLHLIVKRHLPLEAQKWDQKDLISALNKISHLRLDREKIKEIDSLELLGDSVTNIYLQRNRIEQIENLDCLKNITFLTLANNRIKVIENLKPLTKLIFLDLSENFISEANSGDLPQSVIILNLSKNPCTSYPHYRRNLISGMSRLKQLDLQDVTKQEKQEVGLVLSSDDDEEEDDDEEQETNTRNVGGGNGHGLQDNFQTMTTTMMLKSQRRAEDALQTHKNRKSEMNDLRMQLKIPPSARRTNTSSDDL